MIPALVVAAYLALVLYVGIFAFRKGTGTGEDYFVASRALGPYVFLLALFGTNMTAFAILGSSGLAYQRGIGVFGLMASASAFVIPLTLCIMAIWLPCVLLGVIAAQQFPGLKPGESDEVILRLLTANTHVWLADALGAASTSPMVVSSTRKRGA